MRSGNNSKSHRNKDLLSRPVKAKEIPPDGVIAKIAADASNLYSEYPGFERQVAQLNQRIQKLVHCHSRYHAIASQYGDEGVERISFLATMKVFLALRIIERIEKCFPSLNINRPALKTRYLKSIRHPEAAAQFLHVFLFSEDRRKTRGVSEEDLLNQTTPTLLDGLTNELIFTGSVSESIRRYSSWILKRAELGDASFFAQFGEWVEKATARKLVISFERWLLNNWLPLALWTLSPIEAVALLREYANLIQAQGPFTLHLGKDEEIKRNIRRFKMRLIPAERK
jgi:hypothetical protein